MESNPLMNSLQVVEPAQRGSRCNICSHPSKKTPLTSSVKETTNPELGCKLVYFIPNQHTQVVFIKECLVAKTYEVKSSLLKVFNS